MTKEMRAINSDERLALVGLFLMLMVARLANHGGFLARRAIDAIAVVGWIADRLSSPVAACSDCRHEMSRS